VDSDVDVTMNGILAAMAAWLQTSDILSQIAIFILLDLK
jgi:hypothetical protein